MVVQSTSASRVGAKAAEAVSLVLKRPWDPVAQPFVSHKVKKLPGSPLLLLIPSESVRSDMGNSRRMRFWNSHLMNMGKVIPVTVHAGSNLTVSQYLEHMIGAIRTKVSEVQTHFPNRSIVLVGWNVGALAACHVALVETVSAIVCLGFPFLGINGKRGDVDDPLLESKAPILFIMGERASLCRRDDLEEMREHMRAETSLVVVGDADDHLRLSHAKKKLEGVTTSMVDRCILDEISEFLGSILTRHPAKPNLDTSYTSTGSTNSSDSSSVKEARKRKKKVIPASSQDTWNYSSYTPVIRRKPSTQQVTHKNGATTSKVVGSLGATSSMVAVKRHMAFAAKRRRIPATITQVPTKNLPPNKGRPMWSLAAADSLSSDSSNQSQPSNPTPTQISDADILKGPSRFSVGTISTLAQPNRGRLSEGSGHGTTVFYKRIPGSGDPRYAELIAAGRGGRLKIARGGSVSSSANSAFFTVPKASPSTSPSAMSLLGNIGGCIPNYVWTTVASRVSLLSGQQLVEPDQTQVQAIQRLQFHDFPLTTASLTKTNSSGNPVITQAKILSNFNKMQGLVTTSTATTDIRQSLLPGQMLTSTSTTQSLLSSTASAFVRGSGTVCKTYVASPASIVSAKQAASMSLLGSNVARVVDSNESKDEDFTVMMLDNVPGKSDFDLPTADLDINKALVGVDLPETDEDLLDIIGDINKTIEGLTENPLPVNTLSGTDSDMINTLTNPIDPLDFPSQSSSHARDLLLDDPLRRHCGILQDIDSDTLMEPAAPEQLPQQHFAAVTPLSPRSQRLVLPTIVSTRTRRIKIPKYYDM